jgi:electron transport complex protein RnfA
MSEYVLILLSAALVNNFVLARFLGLCPFFGVSRKLETAFGMALATAFVLTLAAALSHLLNRWLLAPLGLDHLRTLTFILTIAAVVQFTEMVVHKASPVLYNLLGIFLPLITTNCAVLGVALLNLQAGHGFLASVLYGLGAAAGFALALVLFAGLRERMVAADVPSPFRGAPIALVTAGIMSLAFLGFSGLIKGN